MILEISVAIVLTIGLTEAIKKAVGISSRYAPIVALGIGVGIVALGSGIFSSSIVLDGIVVGLSASGLYSGVKKSVKG